MVLELSNSPRSVTVMARLARLTVAVISSAAVEAVNFHFSPPPMKSRPRMAPPAQNVRRRRYQIGTLRLGAFSRIRLAGGEPPTIGDEPGGVSAGRTGLETDGGFGGLIVGVISRYLALIEL